MADERPEEKRDDSQGRRNGRRRGFRGRHLGRAAENSHPQGADQTAGGRQAQRDDAGQKPRDMPSCPICGKPVYDLSTAIAASREAGDPAHFDCVLERVVASENIAAGEKLVYLGSGAFGVVEFKDNKSESAFMVKRRIQWEKEGEKKDWRKGISLRISNL